ncbi:MAG: LacI family DNA-binding transcriptional regulator [Prolixibacteraceae bacterium]|jgi:LacI family transcriptional regulator|nr:LacI family DNA-binding transcriptional regulator [Prolixibacteraceae bacterium]
MKRITIKDIAKDLNLHHSTVSRALRDEKSIHPDTRKKVLAYARQKGYQVNRSALHLRGGKNNVIGIVVPNIHHSFFSNYVSRVTNLAFEHGFVVSVFQSNESLVQEKEIIKALIQHNVAGVMASVSMETDNASHFSILKQFRIPLVLFDRVDFSLDVPKVVLNNNEILDRAVKFLASRGFSRIAYLSGPPVTNVFRDRQQGYAEAINREGLSYRNCLISDNFSVESSQRAIAKLFENDCPDALICDSHIFMLGTMIKLKELGMRISEDFGLAGFGSFAGMSLITPGLLILQQPEADMAEAAFNLLANAIEDKPQPENKNTIVFSGSIVETEGDGNMHNINL